LTSPMSDVDRINPSPLSILWHYASGYMPDFLNRLDGPVGWVRWSHRGVHPLGNIDIPKRQQRYVFAEKYEVRVDTAFEQVLAGCADPQRFGKTWLTPNLQRGLLALHRSGHAHSWETWMDGQLVAGVYGLQIGGYVVMCSMFHQVSHAAKAALGRGLLQLRDQGFEWVDRGMVPNHSVDYGVQWWPRWKYEQELYRVQRQRLAVAPHRPVPRTPAALRLGIPLLRMARGLRRRLWTDTLRTDAIPLPRPPQDT